MPRKLILSVISSALLLTMCTFYDQAGTVSSPNGLTCQTFTKIGALQDEQKHFSILSQAARCSYQCPDGKFTEFEIPGEFSPSSRLYSASKEELNGEFCGASLQPTPTQPPASMSPISTVFPTASSTEQASFTPTLETPTEIRQLLLTGEVTMCDLAVDLINFRMVEPVPDLTGKDLVVEIADQRHFCTINQVNTSLLTCTLPAVMTFPLRVVVRLNGDVVNDFTYDGLGCAKIATPFPTLTPQ